MALGAERSSVSAAVARGGDYRPKTRTAGRPSTVAASAQNDQASQQLSSGREGNDLMRGTGGGRKVKPKRTIWRDGLLALHASKCVPAGESRLPLDGNPVMHYPVVHVPKERGL